MLAIFGVDIKTRNLNMCFDIGLLKEMRQNANIYMLEYWNMEYNLYDSHPHPNPSTSPTPTKINAITHLTKIKAITV